MRAPSHENLKMIRFEGELLPHWARLLDVAAKLCPVFEDTKRWFSKFTNASGEEDSHIVIFHCTRLRVSLQEHRDSVATQLQRRRDDGQPAQILGGWFYALDTMLLEAGLKKNCSWIIEGVEESPLEDSNGGDINLRRI